MQETPDSIFDDKPLVAPLPEETPVVEQLPEEPEDEQAIIDREYKMLKELVTLPYLPKMEKLPKFCESIE